MFAIFKTGGNQYKVKPGKSLKIEKIDKEEGESVEFENVLLKSEDEELEVGAPVLEDSKIKAEVLEQGREDKKVIFRYKPKTRQSRKQGHKQPYTKVRISSIE
ncbi:MAG: 50S ribosomal protein L21 [Candidatus Magasanikbacteria bacterium]